MSKRAFSRSDTPEKATDYHGGCRYAGLSPDIAGRGVKSVNIDISFEEALKLSLALESCLHAVNRYNRSTAKGRAMGVCLSLKTEAGNVTVIEVPVRSAVAPAAPEPPE